MGARICGSVFCSSFGFGFFKALSLSGLQDGRGDQAGRLLALASKLDSHDPRGPHVKTIFRPLADELHPPERWSLAQAVCSIRTNGNEGGSL